MREILFKGKRVDGEGWVEGCFCECKASGCSYIITEFFETPRADRLPEVIEYLIDPKSLCQFTGLLDKNGKKIFEGDIVSGSVPDSECDRDFTNCEIVFDEGGFNVHLAGGYIGQLIQCTLNKSIEIVGNIHDNK